ncbi:IclR family transcriptional regulator [Phenylobacterium sp.]|uniref:IclR family transcriptional regulator n=1 Tax=Phenylobacterium sp. TaxID=1871053 RepID=UPI00391C5CD9
MTDNVLSAGRVLDLLEFIAQAPEAVSLRDATHALAAPKSSTLMLLRTLVNRGYVQRDATTDRYRLSDDFRAGAFGWTVDPNARLVTLARPILEALSREIGETCTLGIWDEPGQARLLVKVVADLDVRYDTDVSRPIPLYCTAIGRALLSTCPAAERARLLGEGPFPAVTRHTLTDRRKILARIEHAAEAGFASVEEEFALGGTGVAAPVLGPDGRALAALNVGCVTNRFEEKREQVIGAVKRWAGVLAAELNQEPQPRRRAG